MELSENNNLARYVTRLLLALGFSPRHFGFKYIREMILIATSSNNKKLSQLYLQVSLKFNLPVEAIQTAVRTSLKTAQEQKCFSRIEKLFGANFIEKNYMLAPREFVGIILEYLVYVWDGENELF